MLDLILLAAVAWMTLLGYRIGPLRMLISVSALSGTFYILKETVPWVQPIFHSPLLAQALQEWMQKLMQPVVPVLRRATLEVLPVLSNPYAPFERHLRTSYVHIIAFGYAGAVGFAVLMGLRSMETLWPETLRRHSQGRDVGALLGALTGIYAAASILSFLAAYAWVSRFPGLRMELYHSVFAHTWTQLLAHGIVEEK